MVMVLVSLSVLGEVKAVFRGYLSGCGAQVSCSFFIYPYEHTGRVFKVKTDCGTPKI